MKDKIKIESCSFDLVLPIWQNYLWPGRKTPIESFSALKRTGGINLDYKNRDLYFFSAVKMIHNEHGEDLSKPALMGVVSGHQTENYEFRLRGLYVFEKYRNQGVGHALLQEVESKAILLQSRLMWSLPRKTNFIFYQKNGFKQVSDWSHEYEFGPNCTAVKELDAVHSTLRSPVVV